VDQEKYKLKKMEWLRKKDKLKTIQIGARIPNILFLLSNQQWLK